METSFKEVADSSNSTFSVSSRVVVVASVSYKLIRSLCSLRLFLHWHSVVPTRKKSENYLCMYKKTFKNAFIYVKKIRHSCVVHGDFFSKSNMYLCKADE